MHKFNTLFLGSPHATDPKHWLRYGAIWNTSELAQLSELFTRGATLEHMCRSLGRPPSGVVAKLEKFGFIKEVGEHGNYVIVDTNATETQTTEEPAMNTTAAPVIETKTFIAGSYAAEMSDEAIFRKIADLENKASAWQAIKTRPAKLQATIDKIYADIQALVAYVDGR